jgi:hypothetical protein
MSGHSFQPGQHASVRGMRKRQHYHPPGTSLKAATPTKGAQHRRNRKQLLQSRG